MSSGGFAPRGDKAGLTEGAGRTSFSPDPLSSACLNACASNLGLAAAVATGSFKPERAASPRTRHRPGEQQFGVPPPAQVGGRNRRLV